MPVRVVPPPTPDDLERAWCLVREHLAATPVLASAALPGAALKLETAQPTGAYKVRGGLSALAALPAGVPAVAASAGNHALGLGFAASRLSRSAVVVVPENASAAKLAALTQWPVRVVRHGTSYDEAEAYALDLAARDGGEFISGYNDPKVIAGAATIGYELDDQLDGPLTVVCGIGGGGLSSGLALWAASQPGTDLICVEAAASMASSTSVRAGHVVHVDVGPTLADGLAGNTEPGSVTVAILAELRPTFAAVTEEQIVAAIRWLYREHGLVVEGAAAVGVAAAISGQLEPASRPVFVLSGRNIAARTYADLLS